MRRARVLGRPRWTGWAADGFLILAALALVCSIACPRIRQLVFEHRVQDAIRNVNAMRTSALRFHRDKGEWPARATFTHAHYRLGWHLWNALERPGRAASGGAAVDISSSTRPTVDTLAGITLESPEKPLLAALLDHYGAALSFARDSSWTLMIPIPGAAGPRADSAAARAP